MAFINIDDCPPHTPCNCVCTVIDLILFVASLIYISSISDEFSDVLDSLENSHIAMVSHPDFDGPVQIICGIPSINYIGAINDSMSTTTSTNDSITCENIISASFDGTSSSQRYWSLGWGKSWRPKTVNQLIRQRESYFTFTIVGCSCAFLYMFCTQCLEYGDPNRKKSVEMIIVEHINSALIEFAVLLYQIIMCNLWSAVDLSSEIETYFDSDDDNWTIILVEYIPVYPLYFSYCMDLFIAGIVVYSKKYDDRLAWDPNVWYGIITYFIVTVIPRYGLLGFYVQFNDEYSKHNNALFSTEFEESSQALIILSYFILVCECIKIFFDLFAGAMHAVDTYDRYKSTR